MQDTAGLAIECYERSGDVLAAKGMPLDVDSAVARRAFRKYQFQFHPDRGSHTVIPQNRFVHMTEWSWFSRSPKTWVIMAAMLMDIRRPNGPAPCTQDLARRCKTSGARARDKTQV